MAVKKGPDISAETLKEMAEFFAKTSVPRILEEHKKIKESGKNGNRKTA